MELYSAVAAGVLQRPRAVLQGARAEQGRRIHHRGVLLRQINHIMRSVLLIDHDLQLEFRDSLIADLIINCLSY